MFNITIDHSLLLGVINAALNTGELCLLAIVMRRQRVVRSELEVHNRKSRRWGQPESKEKLTMVGSVELEEKENA